MTRISTADVRPEPMDVLTALFYRLDMVTNVNTNQIVLVDGLLDARLLERAVRETIPRYPILLSRPSITGKTIVRGAYEPGDVPFVLVRHEGPMDFSSRHFRRAILSLSERSPIHWDKVPPVQFFLIVGDTDGRSCIYMNTSHAVADAKSDSMLIEAIMGRYGGLAEDERAAGPVEAPKRDFASLQQIMPEIFGARKKIRRIARGVTRGIRDMVRSDDDWAVSPSKRVAAITQGDVGNDFHHEILPAAVDRALKQTAAEVSCTLNTLFTAALVRVIEKRNDYTVDTNYVRLTCAVSMRQLVGTSYKHDFRSYFVPCNLVIAKLQSPHGLIAQIQRQVRQLKQGGAFDEVGKMEAVSPLLRWRRLRRMGLRLIETVQGTNACYSNPGFIEEEFRFFGTPRLPVRSYIGFGCLIPPYDFILYTPTVDGRLYLNAVYRAAAFTDFAKEFIAPLKRQLRELCEQLGCRERLTSAEGRRALRLLEDRDGGDDEEYKSAWNQKEGVQPPDRMEASK